MNTYTITLTLTAALDQDEAESFAVELVSEIAELHLVEADESITLVGVVEEANEADS